MPNCIVHLYHHALRHGESNIVLFPSPFQHQVPHNRNSLFDIQQGDSPAPPIPNDLQSICHIVLIPNTFQSAHCKCQIPCKVCNTHLPYIHTSINPDLSIIYIDSFNFENDRSCAVVAAGDHDFIVIHPTVHDAPSLQRRVDVAADGIPRFGTERNALRSAVRCSRRLQAAFVRRTGFHKCSSTHVPEIIPFIVAVKQEFITNMVAGAFAAVRHGAVLRLQIWKQLFVQYGYFYSVFHRVSLLANSNSLCSRYKGFRKYTMSTSRTPASKMGWS